MYIAHASRRRRELDKTRAEKQTIVKVSWSSLMFVAGGNGNPGSADSCLLEVQGVAEDLGMCYLSYMVCLLYTLLISPSSFCSSL